MAEKVFGGTRARREKMIRYVVQLIAVLVCLAASLAMIWLSFFGADVSLNKSALDPDQPSFRFKTGFTPPTLFLLLILTLSGIALYLTAFDSCDFLLYWHPQIGNLYFLCKIK
jgi:hypothetical protein